MSERADPSSSGRADRTPRPTGTTRGGRRTRPAPTTSRIATPDTEVAERGPGGRWPVADRSVLATVLGLSPLVAVAVAAGATAVGVLVDLLRIGGLGPVFTVCYLVGCVLAVAWVRRDALFGPMVCPPLLVAVAVPVVVLLVGDPDPGAGVAERLLVIGAPLVNAFPIMAWTTGAVLALGVARLLAQRPVHRPTTEAVEPGKAVDSGADGESGGDEPVSPPRRAGGATRGAARTSTSPRRS